jgi:hypothetical membrane protein
MARRRSRTDLGERRDTTARLALAGLWAPGVFVLGVAAAWSTWPGYSHRTQNLSDLGGTQAPQPIVMNVTFVLFGLLVLLLAVGMRRSRSTPIAGPSGLLVGCFGLAMVVQGLTPCTPGCAQGTPTDGVHAITAISGFLAVIVAMSLSWRRARSHPGWRRFGRWSAIAAVVVGVSLGAWSVAAAADPDALHGGAFQRFAVAVTLVWLGATATKLRRTALAGPLDTLSGN